ncbi:hypothetical protein, partial [Parachitinimonas caeni]
YTPEGRLLLDDQAAASWNRQDFTAPGSEVLLLVNRPQSPQAAPIAVTCLPVVHTHSPLELDTPFTQAIGSSSDRLQHTFELQQAGWLDLGNLQAQGVQIAARLQTVNGQALGPWGLGEFTLAADAAASPRHYWLPAGQYQLVWQAQSAPASG